MVIQWQIRIAFQSKMMIGYLQIKMIWQCVCFVKEANVTGHYFLLHWTFLMQDLISKPMKQP